MSEFPTSPEAEKAEHLEHIKSMAQEAKRLEQERIKEAEHLGLSPDASWDEIITQLSPTEDIPSEQVQEIEPSNERLSTEEIKLEIPEGASNKQIVEALEKEAEEWSKKPEIKGEIDEKHKIIFDFANRFERRKKVFMDLLEKCPENHKSEITKQIIDWEQVKIDFKRLPEVLTDDFNEQGTEYYYKQDDIESPHDHAQSALYRLFYRFERIQSGTARMEAYIKPLLENDDNNEELPVRALMAVFKATSFDMKGVLEKYGFEIDDVELLKPLPKQDGIDFNLAAPEGFLLFGRGSTLPMGEMLNMRDIKEEDGIATDVKQLGYRIDGKRKHKTEVVKYHKNRWWTSAYDNETQWNES